MNASVVTHSPASAAMSSVPAAKPTMRELFSAEESPLLRYAFGMVGRREVAEEMVQDAFLKLHEHYSSVENPRAWLYRCVRNLCLNSLRKSRREDIGTSEKPEPTSLEVPDELLARLEAAGELRRAIAELSPRDQQILHFKYYEDRSYAAIAKLLDMSIGNVGSRLHHMLKDLAQILEK